MLKEILNNSHTLAFVAGACFSIGLVLISEYFLRNENNNKN